LLFDVALGVHRRGAGLVAALVFLACHVIHCGLKIGRRRVGLQPTLGELEDTSKCSRGTP
jgi:hypothetical protein